ncbi:MAG TPA: amino acid racemase [candidate division Zixibacteria bacterium]|nr:amino acid racemase [candidate division Zixibacteria bacterium]HPM37643.1 amino acid racemase [candidate division Zixibacteria bacterium]
MKVIGLIGGTGWVSTCAYYRLINELTNERRGGLHAARCLLYSFDYADIDALNRAGDARGVFGLVRAAADSLERAGAECLVLCANTLHQFAEELAGCTRLPLVNVAEAAADEISRRHFSTVGLLGTRMTMEENFYKDVLRRRGIRVRVPDRDDCAFIHTTILTELLKNVVSDRAKDRFRRIIAGLADGGAEAVVLGCTELPLLVAPEDAEIPLIDTLRLHCRAAVDFALAQTVRTPPEAQSDMPA